MDNRDILLICEQQCIAVKSHSSTISEEDAARIRTAAKAQFPQASITVIPGKPTSSQPHPSANQNLDKPQPAVKQKMQIIEVLRPPVNQSGETLSPVASPNPELNPPSRPNGGTPAVSPDSDQGVQGGAAVLSGPPKRTASAGSEEQSDPNDAQSSPDTRGPAVPEPKPEPKPESRPEPNRERSGQNRPDKPSADRVGTDRVGADLARPVATPPGPTTPKSASAAIAAKAPQPEPAPSLLGPPPLPTERTGNAASASAPAQPSATPSPARRPELKRPGAGQSSGQAGGARTKGEPRSQPSKPELVKPEIIRPEALKPDGAKPEGSKPEGGKPEGGKPEGGKPEGGKPEILKSGSAKPEVVKSRNPQGPGQGQPGGGSARPSKPSKPAAGQPASPTAPKPNKPQIVQLQDRPTPRAKEDLKPVRPERPERPDRNAPDRNAKPEEVAAALAGAPGAPAGVVVPDLVAKPVRRVLGDIRPPKKGKAWGEPEEEEDPDNRKGAAKAGAKTKKSRVHIIDIDDDDDLDGDADNDALNGPLSISLERPPKPKSMQAAPKATPAATKGKRPDGQRGRNQRNDRSSQQTAAKRERPELLMITGPMTIQELAQDLVVPETDIIKTLFFKGIAATITQTVDVGTIEMICETLGVLVEQVEEESKAIKTEILVDEDLDHLQLRPPVVTIMGHVDHGKTTLLDSIRKTKVAAGEAGGITQHIGAYHVDVEHNDVTQQVVFLDTPGHAAFTAMRARGANVTDIAILVVAADDGVRPQTIEALKHAQAAKVPIIVAINKIDKEDANPDRVKQELTEYGLLSEEWGGETIMVPVSALRGENLDALLEMILLQAEVLELAANPDRLAMGTVIEANLDKERGSAATLLVQNGTLRVGDAIVAGSVFGKVRAMIDDRGKRVDMASPSFAVEVLGLSRVPKAGDKFEVYADEREARAIADDRAAQDRSDRLKRRSLGQISALAQSGDLKDLNLILKGDVQGSVEAIEASLKQLPQNEVQLKILLSAPGEVTETDVEFAAASDAVILGFNTALASGAKRAADEAGVDIREYDIIYKLLEDVQGAMEGLLEPELVEEPLGEVEVRAVFAVGRGAVAGCYVLSGKAIRNCNIRVRRGKEIVFTGNLDSLKRMKEDAKEVNAGFECGIGLDKFNDWKEGDIIETYRMVTKRRTLAMN